MDRSVPAEGGVTSLREVCPSCTNSKLQLAGIKSVMIPHPMQVPLAAVEYLSTDLTGGAVL